MRRRRTRTFLVYKGLHPLPRLATPLETLLGDEYDSLMADWKTRLAEREARAFYSVADLCEYLQRQKAATLTDKPDTSCPVK